MKARFDWDLIKNQEVIVRLQNEWADEHGWISYCRIDQNNLFLNRAICYEAGAKYYIFIYLFIYLFRNSSGMRHEDLQAVLQKYTIMSAGND